MRLFLKRSVAAAAILGAAVWAAGLARAEDNPDDDWKGPGFYQVFYSTDVYLIYSGPYATKQACVDYVQSLSDDYMKNMTQKYGDYGDMANGWLFECIPLNTKAEWHDLDQ
jgi:hypothetical protein